MTSALPEALQGPTASISAHAGSAAAHLRRGFGPRVRKLHARIGKAHHHAEGLAFSRRLLAGEATPLQLAALLHNLAPAYGVLEQTAPNLARSLGADQLPWPQLRRSEALRRDLDQLAVLPDPPDAIAARDWLERLQQLASQHHQRLLAHVYVRYGGDLSGGQQLAAQARVIVARHGLPPLAFWSFAAPVEELKLALHQGFEQLQLNEAEEREFLDEAEFAFLLTQRLLAELDTFA